ncbi:unnamed protein product, partial [Rotaria magnacalcarata]
HRFTISIDSQPDKVDKHVTILLSYQRVAHNSTPST